MKIRVWNTKTRKYVEDLVAIKYYDGEPKSVTYNTDEGHNKWENPIIDDDGIPWLILERSTGLKDKNGNMIFEGDVVKCYDWGLANQLLHEDEIVWDIDETGWNFKSNWVEDRYDFRKAIAKCEVIGNIHEINQTK